MCCMYIKSSKTGNVNAYFSGHYEGYEINLQATCDHICKFVYSAFASPWGANEITPLRKTKCSQIVKIFQWGKIVIGDNAYVCTESLLTRILGAEKVMIGKVQAMFI